MKIRTLLIVSREQIFFPHYKKSGQGGGISLCIVALASVASAESHAHDLMMV